MIKIEDHVKELIATLINSVPNDNSSGYVFFVKPGGRKYYKVMMRANANISGTLTQDSVHCFIDKKTGEVYKPASLNGPAKGVRYDLRLIKDREWLFANATWHGSYLYKR